MLYITYIELFDGNYTGIRKKILAQIKVLEKKFGDVYYTCYAGHMLFLMKDHRVIEKRLAISRERCNEAIISWIEKYGIKRTYIRYAFADKWFLGLLEWLQKKRLNTVLEIPTYPYDGEVTNKHVRLEDGYYREQIYQYINFVATNVEEEKIWGIPCIKLANGVDLDENPLRKRRKEKNKIVMIAVSTLMEWQGFERILAGLYQFYKHDTEYELLFKIVGEGPEKEVYRSLMEEYHLECFVEFCGRKDGKDLDCQYDLADIAVSSLGRYKSGVQDFSPIKGAEYCARGIPFICGYHDIRFHGKEDFILNVPNSPEPIDMGRVIAFYEKISSRDGYEIQMRDYAARYLSWDIVMQPIIDALQ